ncbi:MAG: peptidoglycan-binding protein [Devosia sp.]
MTAMALAEIPFQAGGAIAAAAGRGAVWAIGHYMRQPLRNSGLVLLVGLSSLAVSNALYFQTHRHPAPLFGVAGSDLQVAEEQAPAVPAPRPKSLKLPLADTTTTGSVSPSTGTAAVIGNAEVFEVQRKLKSFGLFDATVDGLYGPRTARAIKAFEERQGLKPLGELTTEIVRAILKTTALDEVAALPEPDPLPTVKAKVAVQVETEAPAALTLEALPAPEPLDASPVDQTASIDAAAGTQTLAMTKPNTVAKRIVQAIPVKAITQSVAAAVAQQPLPEPLAAAVETALGPVAELAAPTALTVEPTVEVEKSLIEKVQKGLASLGFLHTAIDGVAGEATAKAVRNFEVYYRYDVTGRITPELLGLLEQNGALL